MEQSEKLLILSKMCGEDDEAVLLAYLRFAAEAIINRVYPFDSKGKCVPKKYEMKQIQIAAFLLNKRGAEGEVSHSENGISRSYENADIPESMLSEITPFVEVL